MSKVTVRVPGKVMLSGEYAVLYGGSSVLTPVPRYLELSGEGSKIGMSYPPALEASLHETLLEINFNNTPILDYESLPPLYLNDDQFYHFKNENERLKLGIGSSAAQVVAGISFRLKFSGIDPAGYTEEIFRVASSIHSKVQAGIGSGADVAVCSIQKPLEYKKTSSGWYYDVLNLQWLQGKLHLVWTGIPANTRELVSVFTEWAESRSSKVKSQLLNLNKSADYLATAFQSNSFNQLKDAWTIFFSNMRLCADESGLPWRSDIHLEIEEWAAKHNCLAKPTGAGQGDMVLLLGDAPFEELEYLSIPVM